MWKILSSEVNDTQSVKDTVSRQCDEVRNVWNGTKYRNFGIERFLMLLLSVLPFLGLGLYLRNICKGDNMLIHRKLVTDLYVLLNLCFPFFVLFFGLYKYSLFVILCVYFSLETIVALLSMLFLNIPKPISYRRNLLCLFLNFLQFTAFYAVLYLSLGKSFVIESCKCCFIEIDPLRALYFSLETLTTVGYGDVSATTNMGYVVLIVQMLTSLLFIGVFFSVFSSKIGEGTFYNIQKK